MAKSGINEEKRRELVATPVTIDLKKAGIAGVKNQFATVRSLDGSVSAEWSWDAVERIVAKGGKFSTK